MTNLYDKLQKQVDRANWSLLARYFAKGALIKVDSNLDLVKVGIAIAEDDVNKIQSWQKDKFITQVSDDDALKWSSFPEDYCFCHFLILSPYVIIQEFPAQ